MSDCNFVRRLRFDLLALTLLFRILFHKKFAPFERNALDTRSGGIFPLQRHDGLACFNDDLFVKIQIGMRGGCRSCDDGIFFLCYSKYLRGGRSA